MFLFLNDFGTDIVLNVVDQACKAVDVSVSTLRQFELEKPDGTILTKTASFVTNGTDGKLRYTIESGVLDVIGGWSVRAKITNGVVSVQRTEKVAFEVRV